MQLDKFGLHLEETIRDAKLDLELASSDGDPISKALDMGYLRALQDIYVDYKNDMKQRASFNLN